MKNQEIDVCMLRGMIRSSCGDEDDIIVIEEYSGDLLSLQNDDDLLLSLQIDTTSYNLTNFLRGMIYGSSGVVSINYMSFNDKLDTINPFKIRENKANKKSCTISYQSEEDFVYQFNKIINKSLRGFSQRFVYMEISICRNNNVNHEVTGGFTNNPIKIRKHAARICGFVEELLERYHLNIPDDNRQGDPDEAYLFGDNYCNLENDVVDTLMELVDEIKSNPEMEIDKDNL